MPGQESNEEKRCNKRIHKSPTRPNRIQMETQKQHKRPRRSKLPGPGSLGGLKTLRFFERDLDKRTAYNLALKPRLAIDTETEGLDYRKHKLRLVQLCTDEGRVYIIRNPRGKNTSPNLHDVLLSYIPTKVFHHAMFDLRFLKAGMRIEPAGAIECTKVMMKIVKPDKKSGIGSLLGNMLKIHLPKLDIDYSKWNEPVLTHDQLLYSAGDVLYLGKALDKLKEQANQDQYRTYLRAMDVCTRMASLQVEGYTDLFDYEQNSYKVNLEHRNWWLNPS